MIVVVDYGMGNLGSVCNMLKRLGENPVVASKPEAIEAADKLILPGVGAFDRGMASLNGQGLAAKLSQRVMRDKIPVLGICLGMQLFSRGSKEGRLPGLAWLRADTIQFGFGGDHAALPIPHMGWNTLSVRSPHPIIDGLPADSRFFFVHSYHLRCDDPRTVIADTEYGYAFPSVVAQDNVIGVQFHPEKSHRFGLELLRNFVRLV
jgi:glutamine amidotransferase